MDLQQGFERFKKRFLTEKKDEQEMVTMNSQIDLKGRTFEKRNQSVSVSLVFLLLLSVNVSLFKTAKFW